MVMLKKVAEQGLSWLTLGLSILVMVAGVLQMTIPVEPLGGALGFLYSSRFFLVSFGTIVFLSGLTLFLGRVKKRRKMTGVGLMAIYLVFLFGTLLNGYAMGWEPTAWVGNAVFTVGTGLLWLRWKFKTEYIDPKYFVDWTAPLRDDRPPS